MAHGEWLILKICIFGTSQVKQNSFARSNPRHTKHLRDEKSTNLPISRSWSGPTVVPWISKPRATSGRREPIIKSIENIVYLLIIVLAIVSHVTDCFVLWGAKSRLIASYSITRGWYMTRRKLRLCTLKSLKCKLLMNALFIRNWNADIYWKVY